MLNIYLIGTNTDGIFAGDGVGDERGAVVRVTINVAKTEVTARSRLNRHPKPALAISNELALPIRQESVADLGKGDNNSSVLQVLNTGGLNRIVGGVGALVECPPFLQRSLIITASAVSTELVEGRVGAIGEAELEGALVVALLSTFNDLSLQSKNLLNGLLLGTAVARMGVVLIFGSRETGQKAESKGNQADDVHCKVPQTQILRRKGNCSVIKTKN